VEGTDIFPLSTPKISSAMCGNSIISWQLAALISKNPARNFAYRITTNYMKMKEYHTKIEIIASIEKVWEVLSDFEGYNEWNPLVSQITGDISEGGTIKTTIVPLRKTYSATLLSFKENGEMIWKGKQMASFLLAGKHYYILKKQNDNLTTLEHGEYFTGVFSVFISKRILQKMENAFVAHNIALKQRVENEK
jgi:hypothetical protein